MIGFIGTGNMARAIIGGLISSGEYKDSDIFGSSKTCETREFLEKEFGIKLLSNIEIAKKCDIIFLCVKPYYYDEVLEEIKDYIEGKILVSIAPLKTIDYLRSKTHNELKCVSSMPNTPALVGAGMSAICFSENILENEKEFVTNIFKSFGKVEEVAETLFPAVIAVSGSSPAYVYMFIEALADGAVRLGMPREQAYVFASHAVLGSAKMVLETKEHPGKLKDNVCSPGGTTIEAVASLEKTGFRNSVMEAMDCCVKKINK